MYQISQCKNNKNAAHTQHFFLQMPFVCNTPHSLKHEIALSNNLKTDVYNTKHHVVFPIRFFCLFLFWSISSLPRTKRTNHSKENTYSWS